MATTIADTLKRLGAAALERISLFVGIVDDNPPDYEDGDVKPALINKITRGIIVHVANASGAAPDAPSIVQGTDGITVERLATHAAQTDRSAKTQVSNGTNEAAVLNTAPTTQYGLVTRNIPSGTQNTTEALSSTGPTSIAPKTVPTGTAEAIVASSTPATKYVRVTSDFANTKTVYVSGMGVTVANGQPLGPGDVYTNNQVDNANLIYCISADAAQVLRIEVL